jgi:hypothetical protein
MSAYFSNEWSHHTWKKKDGEGLISYNTKFAYAFLISLITQWILVFKWTFILRWPHQATIVCKPTLQRCNDSNIVGARTLSQYAAADVVIIQSIYLSNYFTFFSFLFGKGLREGSYWRSWNCGKWLVIYVITSNYIFFERTSNYMLSLYFLLFFSV